MPSDNVISEETKAVPIMTGRKELKRSYANMAGGYSRENSPRKQGLARHHFS